MGKEGRDSPQNLGEELNPPPPLPDIEPHYSGIELKTRDELLKTNIKNLMQSGVSI
jgi:hypothetical protein